MKRLGALCLVLVVAACAASTMENLTPQQRIFALKGEFDILLAEVVAYADQPECTATLIAGCSEPAIVGRAVELAEDADEALDQAEAVVRAGGTPDDAAGYAQFARAAVAQLSGYLLQNGIGS